MGIRRGALRIVRCDRAIWKRGPNSTKRNNVTLIATLVAVTVGLRRLSLYAILPSPNNIGIPQTRFWAPSLNTTNVGRIERGFVAMVALWMLLGCYYAVLNEDVQKGDGCIQKITFSTSNVVELLKAEIRTPTLNIPKIQGTAKHFECSILDVQALVCSFVGVVWVDWGISFSSGLWNSWGAESYKFRCQFSQSRLLAGYRRYSGDGIAAIYAWSDRST